MLSINLLKYSDWNLLKIFWIFNVFIGCLYFYFIFRLHIPTTLKYLINEHVYLLSLGFDSTMFVYFLVCSFILLTFFPVCLFIISCSFIILVKMIWSFSIFDLKWVAQRAIANRTLAKRAPAKRAPASSPIPKLQIIVYLTKRVLQYVCCYLKK